MERVRKIGIGTGAERRAAAAILETLLAKLIIDIAFLLIRKHLVRLSNQLELLLRFRRFVLIRMVLQSQLAVGLLYFLFSRCPTDAKNCVIILAHLY